MSAALLAPELVPGLALASRTLPPITAEQLHAYAEASGDRNPIHLDEEAARKAGLPGIIAHGMLSAAFLGNLARSFAQDQGLMLLSLQTRFKSMTRLGDTLTLSGSVKAVSGDEVTLDLQIRNQNNEVTTASVVKLSRLSRV